MEIRLKKSAPTHRELSKEDNSGDCMAVGAGQTIPSYVVEPGEIGGLLVRVMGLHTPWSQEVFVSGDKKKENRLLMVGLEFVLICS